MEAPEDARRLSSSRMEVRRLSLVKAGSVGYESDNRQPTSTSLAEVATSRGRRGVASAGPTRQKSTHTKVHFFSKFHKRHEAPNNQDLMPDATTARKPYVASQQGPAPIAPFMHTPRDHDLGTAVDHRGNTAIMKWLEEFPREESDFLSPTNFFEMKYSQARRLTDGWPEPQRLRLAVAYTALTSMTSRHLTVPPLLLSRFLEDLRAAIFVNCADFAAAQDAIDLNPFLFYYQQATTYFDMVRAKTIECDRLTDQIAKLTERLALYQSKQKRAVSNHVVDRFRTSMHVLKSNVVAPQSDVSVVTLPEELEQRLPTELEIKDYFSLMTPDTLASMLHRIFQEPNMPSLTTTLAHLVDELDPDQRQAFYRAYQKCMSADELFNFIAQEINVNNPYIRDATLRLTKKSSNVHFTEIIQAIRRHLLLDGKPVPPVPNADSPFTAEETQLLVTVESFMTRLHALRKDVGDFSLVEIIPRNVLVRTDVAKLLQFLIDLEGGDPSSVMDGVDEDAFDDHCEAPPEDEDDDAEDDGEFKPAKKTRKKAKKRRSTVLSRLKSRLMPLYDVCTTISSLVCEKLMQDANDKSLQSQPLRVFTRQYFIRVYGLKSLALSHIASFRAALLAHYKDNPRVGLFYWFLGLDETRVLSAELGFVFFKTLIKNVIHIMTKVKSATMNQLESAPITTLESLMYAWNDLIGDGYSSKDLLSKDMAVPATSTATFRDKKRVIPVPKALEVVKLCFTDAFEKDPAVVTCLEGIKSAGTSALPMEDFLVHLMDVWSSAFDRLVVELRLKFKEADKNGDGTMDFEEFYAFVIETKMLVEDGHRARDGNSSDIAEVRQINALRRKAIAIYDSLANEDNIVDETRFVTYMLAQVVRSKARKTDEDTSGHSTIAGSES
ncbi:hypothetical protein ACHHYP_05426 [Achlya hypogyna]|uniref:EF-hand domain-containing protein n=1 Tax=Achlya hypogyna TaxID=1202772 RepID=A0A1V9ZNS7_ACHHY|nr:hypothetical protein ACHHYP_05426 [Achlya hypogyna]